MVIIDSHAHIFDRVRGVIGSGVVEPLPFGNLRLGNGAIKRFMPPISVYRNFKVGRSLGYLDQNRR